MVRPKTTRSNPEGGTTVTMKKNYNQKILTLHMRLNRSADVRTRKIIRAEIDRLAQEERELKKKKNQVVYNDKPDPVISIKTYEIDANGKRVLKEVKQ